MALAPSRALVGVLDHQAVQRRLVLDRLACQGAGELTADVTDGLRHALA
jgi:hypothetical protein